MKYNRKCTNCTKRIPFLMDRTSCKKKKGKVIHNFAAEKAQKSSYTRSYARYPQKKSFFLWRKKFQKRTIVL